MVPVQIHVPGGILAATLLATLALTGCGGTTTTTTSASASAAATPTPNPATPPATPPPSSPPPEKESRPTKPPPTLSIPLTLPGLGTGEHAIPTANTCDGTDTPLTFHWSAIPPHTAELALFILNLRPPAGKGLFIDWAVTGIPPTTTGITAGKLPTTAIVGHNSYGTNTYSICPAKGIRETYVARLIALPHPIPAKPGFNAQTYYTEAENTSKYVGLNGGSYTRP
jgi:phosphatidylethanolamine-binding protein (PEBP) family uncharacterized protein